LEFEINAIPALSTVNSAVLNLYSHEEDVAGTISLYGYVGNGIFQDDDFRDANKNPIVTFMPTPNSLNEIIVTDFIQNLVNSGGDFAGFQLRQIGERKTSLFYSSKREDKRPFLEVDYTLPIPVPPTALLLVSGLIGLVGLKRRLG